MRTLLVVVVVLLTGACTEWDGMYWGTRQRCIWDGYDKDWCTAYASELVRGAMTMYDGGGGGGGYGGLPSYSITSGPMTVYSNGWSVYRAGSMTFYNW